MKTRRSKVLHEIRNLQLATRLDSSDAKSKLEMLNLEALNLDENIQNNEARARDSATFQRSPRPGIGETHNGGSVEERKKKFSKAFQAYALRGQAALIEHRDLLTTSDSTGGALIPQIFSGLLIDAAKFYGPIAQRVRQKVTDNNGAPIKVSLDNDTSHGLTLLSTEGTSGPAETDPSFQSKLLGVDTVTGGLVKVSFQELEDSQFDLDTFIREKFALRYGRGMETAVTLGTDTSGTTLPNQAAGGLLAAATVGTTTATLAGGIGWSDMTAAYGALDPAYVNPNTAWVFNSTTRATLLGMKDGFGRPFWTPDPSADGPFDKLLGYDVVIDQAMPNIGTANGTPILFGDLSRAYLLRTDGQPSILRLNERYADTLEVGFFLWTRIGGISLNAGISPLVAIKQAAS
jgi:HK97 family phage major capsid protein